MNWWYELQENPEVITREWYKKTFSYDWSDADFTNVAGVGDHFDPEIAKQDLATLTKLAEGIVKYVDRRIAHKSKQPVPLVRFEEVDKFIKEYEEILKKYILLFTASGYTGLRPIPQYDWEEIFTRKWIPDEEK